MYKQKEKLTNDEIAKNEPPVTANSLLEEIKPLFSDYFKGKINSDGDGIIYELPNGQRFLITAKEVK